MTRLYEYLGVLLVLILALGGAYYKGYADEHEKFAVYQASVKQLVADQTAASLAKDKENEASTQSIVQTWKSDHDRLVASLGRLRQQPNGSGTMPQAVDSQPGHDDSIAVEGGTCAAAFYSKALDAELMLETWQAWGASHRLTVE